MLVLLDGNFRLISLRRSAAVLGLALFHEALCFASTCRLLHRSGVHHLLAHETAALRLELATLPQHHVLGVEDVGRLEAGCLRGAPVLQLHAPTHEIVIANELGSKAIVPGTDASILCEAPVVVALGFLHFCL